MLTITIGEHFLESILVPSTAMSLVDALGLTDSAERDRVERLYKLSALYGGMDVACKDTPEGTAIIAYGSSESVAGKLADLPDSEFALVYLERPPLWSTLISAGSARIR
jgi:hypothetical protein